jgi:hypothetical protein
MDPCSCSTNNTAFSISRSSAYKLLLWCFRIGCYWWWLLFIFKWQVSSRRRLCNDQSTRRHVVHKHRGVFCRIRPSPLLLWWYV